MGTKEVEPRIDAGNMLLEDLQPISSGDANSSLFLKALARDNAQLLFNELFKLPLERVDNVLVVTLPTSTTLLPRDKPVPKPKPPTKWEAYAAKKGIQNKKRGRMIWDEESSAWKPRFGYKRGKDDTKEWCIEVPEGDNPMQDQFQKREDAKKERVAKNELKRLRNIAKNTKQGKAAIMSTQFKPQQPNKKRDKETLAKEIDIAKASTASVGKFQGKLKNEKPNKQAGKKRKFEAVVGNMASEKQRAMEIWDRVNKKGTLSVTKAVNKKVAEEAFVAKRKKGGGTGKVKNKHSRKGLKPKQPAARKK